MITSDLMYICRYMYTYIVINNAMHTFLYQEITKFPQVCIFIRRVHSDHHLSVTHCLKYYFHNFILDENKEPPPPAGFLAQCYLLYKRQLLCLKRDYTLMVARLLCHLLIGVIFGYLYMGSGYRANGVLANYVYLYGSLLLLVYTGKMAVTLACKYNIRTGQVNVCCINNAHIKETTFKDRLIGTVRAAAVD